MTRKAKILYIEDTPLSKVLIRRILENEGYDVVEADNGLGGVNAAITEHPDLILMDINMPGLDGYEASTMLKGSPGLENIPVVAFTAKEVTKDDHERMLAAGCDGYIPKTTAPRELVELIEAYLHGKREKLDDMQRDSGARAYQRHLVERLQEQIDKLTRANEELTLLNDVAQAITSTLDLDELLRMITHLVEETLAVQACSLLLLDEQTGELIFKAASGLGAEQLMGVRLEPGQGIAGWVAREGESVLINDVRRDARFFSGIDESFSLRTESLICVPLNIKGRIIGVIEALNSLEGKFSQESLQLLDSLASPAALAIEHARLYSQLEEERDTLVRKEEDIRRTIARDLHDGPTQMLSAISMNVDYIKKLRLVAPEKVEKELDNLQHLANEAAHDVRTLLFGLHPTILETQGLKAALEVVVERFQDRRGTKLLLDTPSDLDPYLSKEAEIVAFIIVQEAVNNAKKHSEADKIIIKLRQEDNILTIRVQDEGKGFDLDEVSNSYDQGMSFGLMTMVERARLVNAELDLQSKPGEGTSVTLHLPIEELQHPSTDEFPDIWARIYPQ